MHEIIRLLVGEVSYLGEKSLVQFMVKEVTITSKSSHLVTIDITLKRMVIYHMGSTYAPTVLLLLIAEITLFVDESHFEATTMVSLTTMLVMYTLIQSNSVSLPNTAYLKMIDIWLMHGLIVPFCVFAYHVVNELTRKRKEDFSKHRLDDGANNGYPHDRRQRDGIKEIKVGEMADIKEIIINKRKINVSEGSIFKRRGNWLTEPPDINTREFKGELEGGHEKYIAVISKKISTCKLRHIIRFLIPLSTFLFLIFYTVYSAILYLG